MTTKEKAAEHDLIEPHGGELINLVLDGPDWERVSEEAKSLPKLSLSPRQIADLELLTTGGLSPHTGFMGSADYRSVLSDTRLASGVVWPIPVTLGISEEEKATLGS